MLETGPQLRVKKRIKNKNKGSVTRIRLSFLLFTLPLAPTFTGILAASTDKQFTQEAITSTGGLMTEVSLTDKDPRY